jgi:hypothetical protein
MRFNDDTWIVDEIGMPLTHKKHFLGYARFVPGDGVRIVAPDWYNR